MDNPVRVCVWGGGGGGVVYSALLCTVHYL